MLRIAGLFFAVIVVAAAQQPAMRSTGDSGFRLSGTVVNGSGGEPLSGTSVHIAPTANLQAAKEYVTGEDGRFVFEHLARGKYSLTATRRGFREQGFDQHGNYWTAIVVGPSLDSENLIFRLIPDAQISGTVTEDGDRVPGGQALLFHHSAEEGLGMTHFVESAMIDDQGNYRFSHILAGTYFIAVQAEPWYAQHQFTPVPQPNADSFTVTTVRSSGTGTQSSSTSAARPPEPDPKLDVVYPSTFYEAATDFSSASPMVVHPGEKYQADISLHAVHALRLRVHMNGGDPKQQLSVYVTEPLLGAPAQGGHGMMQRIGDDFEIIGLPPGHLLLNIQTQGASRQEELDLSGDAEISLSEKPPASPLTGTVSFQGADSIPPNAFVLLNNRESGINLQAQIGKDGSFSIQEPIPRGKYQIFIINTEYVVTRVSAAGARVLGQTFEVKGNDAVRLSILATQELGTVDGTAFFNDKPFAGAMIVLVPRDPVYNRSLFRRDQSDSDGTFTLPSIVPGKYTLIAIRDGWEMEWSNPAIIGQYLSDGQQIEIAAHGKYNAKVNVQSLR